jgi:hypothetical protein
MATAELQQAIDIVQRNYKAGIDYTQDKDNTAICILSKEAETVIKALSKAQEIQQAIDDGRAMIMPVKAGEWVHTKLPNTLEGHGYITNYIVYKNNNDNAVRIEYEDPFRSCSVLNVSDFGKTWWKEGER